jgi:DNA mismatch repair protein MutH
MNSYNEVRQALDPVVGVPFRELAPALGIDLPADATRRKQAGGDVVEKVLRIAKNSIPKPDLEYLGTEVKTIPLNTLSRPREWTKITAFNIASVTGEPDFRRSSVFEKLRSILFVPVMKANNDEPDFWYLRPSFLWLPTEDQLVRFESDYRLIRNAAIARDWGGLSSGSGESLTLKTSDTRTRDKSPELKRRAWWLKSSVTREICEQNLWPRNGIEERRDELLGP